MCTPFSTLFPYTTLFRSIVVDEPIGQPGLGIIGGELDRISDEFGLKSRRLLGFAQANPNRRRDLSPNSSLDRKSTRLNSSHVKISYAVFCLKKKKKK